MTTTVAHRTIPARKLVAPELFDRLTRKVARSKGIDPALAERIMDQALAFLGAAAAYPGQQLAPSPTVDVGWHTFLLYTHDYADFCEDMAGRFIHHVPEDQPGAPGHAVSPVTVRKNTIDAITRAGYLVDDELWTLGIYAHDNGCHEDGNCAASGSKGDENTETRKPPHH